MLDPSGYSDDMQGVAIQGLDEARKAAFLAAFPIHRTIKATCEAMGDIHPQRISEYQRDDPSFVEAFAIAKEQVADDLEGELLRRAMSGEGQMPDTLGIFLLKGYRPMFRDSYTVTTKSLNVNIDVHDLPADERRALLELALRQESLPPPSTPQLQAGE